MAMAGSSSTAIHYSYDVFISHRGPDVKKTFASHLYRALSNHGLRVFLDQPELQQGDSLTSQIRNAVTTASIHVAVFSPRYAESSWCLDELLLMLESEKTIIPVFYQVTPAELRWTVRKAGKDGQPLQKLAKPLTPVIAGKYAEALQKLAKKETYDPQSCTWKPRHDSATIEKWRNALSHVAGISGFELEACNGDEGELLDKVVRCVCKKVNKTPLHVAKYPTGLDEKVKDFENEVLLQQHHSGKPPVLGIVGLGGAGKTTLVKELFNRKRSQYSKSCFISDVRENAGKGSLISLQRKLLKSLTDMQVDDIDESIETLLKQHLASSEIFIILDDVDHVDQVDALLPDQAVIRSDSLILITSRYKNILTTSGIEDSSIYKLIGLNEQHSRELFCSHAFNQPYPLSGFESLVDKFSKACGGLPLSLKVFGALHRGQKNPSYWEEQLDKLGRILPNEIKQRLQISFEALDVEEREIFLDIACFFIGENRDMAVRIWDGSHWKGFQNLQDRCLVEVDGENVIHMHDHLRDLGRDIAKAPGLVRGTENIDDLLQQPSPVITDVRGIRTVYGRSEMSWHRGILQVPESEGGLLERILTRVHSPNLIWLRWYGCPCSSLPSWIPVKNLRVLESTSLWEGEWQAPLQLRDLEIRGVLENIPNSIGQLKYLERISLNDEVYLSEHKILALPEEFCLLRSLKTLVLSSCPKMKSLPDSFGNLRNLEFIDLSECHNLERLPKSFGNLTKLKYLNLAHCSKLTMSSETFGNISTLEHINLARCAEIKALPLQLARQRSLEKLYLNGTNLKELPNAIGELSDLEVLVVGSRLLDTLPPSIGDLKNLKNLKLESCDELKWLPASVGLLTQLTELTVWSCPISELPSLTDLRNLKTLSLYDCKELKWLPASVGLLTQLTELTVCSCPISELPSLTDLRNLKTLSLEDCEELKWLPASVGLLTQLTGLTVSSCPISELPSLTDLRNLKTLSLYDCKELKCLTASVGMLTQLTELTLRNCPISELPSLTDLRNLKTLSLHYCKELKWLPASVGLLTQLTELTVWSCPISELPSLTDLRNLKKLFLYDCKELKWLPASVGLLTQLTELTLWNCPLSELPSLTDLRNLKTLYLKDCKELKCLPASVGMLTQLTELTLRNCPLSELPSLTDLRNLKTLSLYDCKELKWLPASVGLLTQLTELTVWSCPISELPSLTDLRNLKKLSLYDCKELKWLPASVGLLTQLTGLTVSSCPISELPSLTDLRNLKTLYLKDCKELKCLPASVGMLTQLTGLTVSSCPISELPSLRNLSNLKTLDLSYCKELKCFAASGLARLQTLDITECKEVEELPSMEALVSLERLLANGCVKLKTIQRLVQLTKLRELQVGGSSELEDLEGVEHLRSLRHLHASKCVKLKSIKGLAQLTELRELNVSECSELEDLDSVEHLRSLEWLQASKCVKLKSIKGLAQLKELWQLNVSECSELEGLEGIEHCRSLFNINASGCPRLSSAVVEQLHERLNDCSA